MPDLIVQVDGMTCDHCNRAIEHSMGGIPGVVRVSADFTNGRVAIRFEGTPDEAAVREAIEDEGYDVVSATTV
ncbi:MAG TPA: heavy metal-associated domain-containing protein [Actinomycetota bacterium]|jgi:copper chaperone